MNLAGRVRTAPQHGWPFVVVEWSDVAWRAPGYTATLDQLRQAGCRTLLVDITRVVIISGATETTYGNDLDALVTAATARGITVHGLAAENTWDSAATSQPLEAAAFAAAHGLAMMWFDVEPWALPDWGTNQAARVTNYLGLVDTVSATATIPTGWFIPFWWTASEASVVQVTYNSTSAYPYTHLVNILGPRSGHLAIMAYRNVTGGGNGALDLVTEEFASPGSVGLWMTQEVAADSPSSVTYAGIPVAQFGNNMATIRAALARNAAFRGIIIENAAAFVPYILPPSAYSPSNITALHTWLDATDAASFTFGTGSAVSQWNDKSGGGHHFAQATSGNRPTRNGAQNGLTTVAFAAASSQYLSAGDTGDLRTNSLTIAIAAKMGSQASETLIGKTYFGSGPARWGLYKDGGALNAFYSNSGGAVNLAADSTAGAAWDVFVVIIDRTTGLVTLRRGGVVKATQGFTAESIDLDNANPLFLGAYPNAAQTGPQANFSLDGQIGEVVVVNSALTGTALSDLEDYLKVKWIGTIEAAAGTIAPASTVTATRPTATVPIAATIGGHAAVSATATETAAPFNMTVAGTGGGNTRYLSTTGSDGNVGSQASPWGSLRFACGQLAPGDTLLVRGGTYPQHDAINFSTAATSTSRILVKNFPGETPIFDGQNGGGNVVVLGNAPGAKYWVFDGLTFTRYYDDSGNGVFSLGSNNNIVIQRCRFIDNGNDAPDPHNDHCIYIADGCSQIMVRNCHMEGQAGAGVHCYGSGGGASSDIQVINCTFFDCYWGVLGGDQNNNLMIAQNTFYLCTSEAISFGWGPGAVGVSGLKVYNNVVVTAGSVTSDGPVALGVGGNATAALTENNNCFYGTTLTTVVQWANSYMTLAAYKTTSGQGAASIGTNPNLDANYRLQSGSPAIGAAIATPSPGPYDYDKDEKVRPVGAARDMGAFEFG